MFLKSNNCQPLYEVGNDEDRIGPDNKRNKKYKNLERIEKLIEQHLGYEYVVDNSSNCGPFFRDYNYYDCLGGIRLHTGSMEINARAIMHVLENGENITSNIDFSDAVDKYVLDLPEDYEPIEKVILLPGNNLRQIVESGALERLVEDGYYIKPHPVTTPELLEFIGRYYGFNNVISPRISGHLLARNAKSIATTAASEFLLLATLNKTDVVDITKLSHKWKCTYGDLSTILENKTIDERYDIVQTALNHRSSGYLHMSLSDEEVISRIKSYVDLTQVLRKPFEPVMRQRMIAADPSDGPICAPPMGNVRTQS